MKPHWNDDEIQAYLEEGSADGARRAHLESCPRCSARLERFRSLFSLLEGFEFPAPSAAFERAVMERLFPSRAPARTHVRRAPVPRWARALAPAMLLAGSAVFYSFLRLAGVLGDNLVRWALQSEPGLLSFGARKLTLLLPVLSRMIDGLVEFVSVAVPVGRAMLLVGHTAEARVMIVASAGLLVLFALGWGTRIFRSRIKGGHHVLLLW
ncbi:MAG: hypothetical protein ABIK65_07300 [Candidatus Eisenbacteria bacterium]